MPTEDPLGDLLIASSDAVSKLLELHFRIVARLASLAEQAENELGLEPLPEVEEPLPEVEEPPAAS